MKKVYIVFDEIPTKKDGGLVATYVNFVRELRHVYDIHFVSIFKSPVSDIDDFSDIPTVNILALPFDNRFYQFKNYIKRRDIGAVLKALWSCLIFFPAILISKGLVRFKLRDGLVIAVAPFSALFLTSKLHFLLEVHINFEYFWGSNLIGRFQSAFMAKPELMIFRNRSDAEKGAGICKSTYLYNTFDDSKLTFNPASDLCTQKGSALFVGRLVDQKNPFMLLDVAESLLSVDPSFSLDIYGDGPLFDTLQSQIRERGLDSCVFLKGFTTDKSIYRHYRFLMVTSEFEGFGLVIIEAAANGIPTVSTNWGDAVFEVIKNGETGYIANSFEEFIEDSRLLLNDQVASQVMGLNAFNRFRTTFSTEQHKNRWIEIIEENYPDNKRSLGR